MTSQQKKKWLQEYRNLSREVERINRRIDACLEEIAYIKTTATRSTSALSGSPGTGSNKGREDVWAKLADLSAEVNCLVDKYISDRKACEKKQKKIITAISSIGDMTLEQILFLRYINERKFEEIALDLDYSIRHIWRLHGVALNRLKIK